MIFRKDIALHIIKYTKNGYINVYRQTKDIKKFNYISPFMFSSNYTTNMIINKGTQVPPPAPQKGLFGKWLNFDVTSEKGKKILKNSSWILDLFNYKDENRLLHQMSSRMYHSCLNQSAQKEFYDGLDIKTNFRGQMLLKTLHIWMLYHRLEFECKKLNETQLKELTINNPKLMQEQLLDRLWEETVIHLRYHDVIELTINKYLRETQQIIFNVFLSLDKGIQANDENILIDTILLYLYANDNSKDIDKNKKTNASILTNYIKNEMKNLKKIPYKKIIEGKIQWGNPPAVVSPYSKDVKEEIGKEIIGMKYGSNWRSFLNIEGKVYYWHEIKRISAWELPANYASI